jgi:hypothetical protein
MMEQVERRDPGGGHVLDQCRCVIDPGCLKLVRRQCMVSLEEIAAGSRFSREYLAGTERGADGKCAEPEIVRAYEQAIGARIDTVVLAMNNSALESLALVHDWLTRLHWAREKKVL